MKICRCDHFVVKCILFQCVPEIKAILSIIFFAIDGAVRFQLALLLSCFWVYVYFILLPSPNRKYVPLAIVQVYVMKQW